MSDALPDASLQGGPRQCLEAEDVIYNRLSLLTSFKGTHSSGSPGKQLVSKIPLLSSPQGSLYTHTDIVTDDDTQYVD
jgi:hypothetical protein